MASHGLPHRQVVSKSHEVVVESPMSIDPFAALMSIYVGSMDGKIYALDGATGIKKWEYETGGEVYSSPAIGPNGTVYVGSNDGKIYALASESKGLAKSGWPMRGRNAAHSGRMSVMWFSLSPDIAA